MKVGAVDIGTNSIRLLITDGTTEFGRWEEVTGLGRGVDRSGALSPAGIEDSLVALAGFGANMDAEGVERRRAIATSAARDAANRELFFDLAQSALSVRPILVSGEEEARLAYAGATAGPFGQLLEPPVVVSDIGGGSTELVTDDGAVSVDIGSVRLTERVIPSRPAPLSEMAAARSLLADLFREVSLEVGTLVGVAGTWTSLAAIAEDLPRWSPDMVHGHRMTRGELESVIDSLAGKTVEETAAIPALHPERAPVILAGSLVAEAVMQVLDTVEVAVSGRDTLDGVAMDLLALP
ncbi:MAG TPA: Ppx/GppA phosphatase family protein [Acidimicrobiia bacterium]|nr:Ppx/GppA phosphatase family protein [Acidimicrobiia bacterium]